LYLKEGYGEDSMPQTLSLKVKGLYTDPNSLDPNLVDGALAVADDVVVDSDNIGESRRGFEKYGQYIDFGSYDKKIESMFNFQNTLIVHYDRTLARDPESQSNWITYSGSFGLPDVGYRIRGVEENQNLYICADSGVKRLDRIDGEFEDAGIVPSLDGFGTATGSGWFEAGKSVGYRMCWAKEDFNKNLIVGAPSSRTIVLNTSGVDANVALTFLIPAGVTTGYKYQIYRSGVTESLTDTPNDEMQLVYEGTPTSQQITEGQFTVLDNLDSDLRGVTLYTSPSQNGIEAASFEPPYCKDMTSYKDHMVYANTKVKSYFEVQLLGTGVNGLQVGDTITIDSVTYTASGVENASLNIFKLYDTSAPAQDIESTAFSLVKVINKSPNNTTVYAYYTSDFDEIPGSIRIVSRSLGGSDFYVLSSRGSAFTPELPSSGTTLPSKNDIKVNRIYFSKQAQPDAVPLYYYIDCGSANQPIKRVIGLRDAIFVFKDDGIYRISGETFNSFTVSLFDNTTKILAPESCVALSNSVFVCTLQGVATIADTGVAIVSRPIEKTLLQMFQYPYFNTATFAISYESDRKYILFCPNSHNQEYPTIAYCYNTIVGSWTRWIITATAGIVKNTDDKIYYGGKIIGYQQGWVYKERKTFTLNDYVDDSWGTQIISITQSRENTYLELNRNQDVVVGYWISQLNPTTGERVSGKIMELDGNTIKVSPASTLYTTDPTYPVEIVKPINCRLKWVQNTALNPGVLKQFRDATLFFKQDTYAELKIGYETNYQPGYTYTTIRTIDKDSWNSFNWGTLPWGGLDKTYNQAVRVGIPRNKQRSLWISISVESSNAFTSFSVAGVSATFESISERLTPNTRF
jgi:hypothetical protein